MKSSIFQQGKHIFRAFQVQPTRSSLSTCTNYKFRKFQTARSLLYQSVRFLCPKLTLNTHFSGFFELYKIHKPSHRSTLNFFSFFANFRWIFESRPPIYKNCMKIIKTLISRIKMHPKLRILIFSWYFGNRGSRFEIDVKGPPWGWNSVNNSKLESWGFRAFHRLKNRRLRTSPSKVMAISKFHKIIKNYWKFIKITKIH